ncbi:MAG: GerAB/ArcD/ProY family transporter, partial [Calditerricola sp.]|nr:GerAB/ArcD/ProY family transporter [Calditerricola sp.]
FLTDRQNGMKSSMLVVVFVTATLTVTNLATLWLFGDITSRLTFPTYRAVQYIDVAQFLQNIDALVMALWVSSVFVKIAVFHYVLVLGTAQWLGLSDYRPLALPLALLVLIMAVWSAPGFSQLLRFIGTALPVYKTVMQILLPLVLLLVSALRRRRSPLPGVESVDRSAGTASTTTGPAGAT